MCEADDTHLPIATDRQNSKDFGESSDEESVKPESVEHNLKDPKCQVGLHNSSSSFFLLTQCELIELVSPQAAHHGIQFLNCFHNTKIEIHLLEGPD